MSLKNKPERGKWVGGRELCQHILETTGENWDVAHFVGAIYCNRCWKPTQDKTNYCPECGAYMKEKNE